MKNLRQESGVIKADFLVDDSTISSNTTLSVGKWYFNNKIIVPSGITLTIPSGTQLVFNNNSSLKVYGTLYVTGSSSSQVTFTFSGTGGILISGSTSSSSNINYATINSGEGITMTNGTAVVIRNSTLNTCTHGIYVYNSSPTINDNQIIDPVQNGMYIDASGYTPSIQSNTIKKNSTNSTYHNYEGIYTVNNSNPTICHNKIGGFDYGIYSGSSSVTFRSDYFAYQNNLLVNNVTGLCSAWGSTVIAGYNGTGGYNSIHGNTYSAEVNNNGKLYAEYNYWSTSYSYLYDNSSYVLDYSNSISTDPWSGATPSIRQQNNSNNSGILASVALGSTSSDDIFSGLNLENYGDISDAITLFLSLIVKDKYTDFVIPELFKIMKQYSRSDILTYFSNFASSSKYYPLVSKLIADNNLQIGQFTKAINTYDNLIKNYPNEYLGINARFQKLFAYLNVNNDKTSAQQILTQIKTLNLTDPQWTNQIQMAENLINGSGSAIVNNRQSGSISKQAESETIPPTEYSLSNNYPNPFNPSTIIEYQLPKNGYVSLKVFDVIGREVKTLVDGYRTVGKYSVSFDASKLASGIYFYQLKANDYTSIKKMILTK